MEKPNNRYEMQLSVSADSLDALFKTFKRLEYSLHERYFKAETGVDVDLDDLDYHSVSGGHDSGWTVSVRFDPNMTHDKYHAQVTEYIEAKKRQSNSGEA